ncbi:MAG: hypothetical protein ACE5LL_02735, partial [Alphaproteobacteria bacterium]
MIGTLKKALIGLYVVPLLVLALSAVAQTQEGLVQGPEGFIPPPLHPAGVELKTKQLAPGVYALLSGEPAVDN